MEKLKFDIQRFDTDSGAEVKKVALEVLNVFGQIVTNLGLKKLAEELDKAKNATEWLTKNANPVLSFIGTTKFGKSFGNYAKLITNSISIIDNTLAIVKGDLPDATRNSKIGSIAASLESMASATAKLTKDKSSENLWFLSIVSGGISLTASLIAGMDGVTESEQEKINRSYITFMRTLGADLVKKIFDDAFEKNLSRAFTESVTDDLLADIFKKGKFFKEAAPVFLKTFNGIMILGSGILNGYNKYKNNLEKYLDDGIPEDMAKHDAFIDALAKFAKETMSGIVFGVDNVIFDVAKWITSGLGIEYAEDENKDYIETLIYNTKLKNFNYTNTGLSTDDAILYVLQDNVMVYGDSGNDAIKNFGFSNATIFGGHDNDTIHSYKTQSSVSNNNVTPCYNSIFGGPGNDQITIYDKYSTIYGGKGEDTIFVTGTNNVIFGDAGNDSIAVFKDANQNTVSGGTGDDKIILLEGAKNALIKYAEGDGNDTIYYFDEDDAIKISGSYKISTNDSDIKIKVGNGSMLLVGAAGKNIKINGKTITNSDADDNTLPAETITPPNVPTMPAIFESPFIYGTDGNDDIYNKKNSVSISSGNGDDSIKNDGSYSTINAGVGNDYINNHYLISEYTALGYFAYRSNYSKLLGGTGDDTITNYGKNVTIDGGDDDDYIENRRYRFFSEYARDEISISPNYSSILGGKGNDTITNYGENVTIDGGAGNDVIKLVQYYSSNYYDYTSKHIVYGLLSYYPKNNLIQYKAGDGNDTILGLDSDDTLKITGAEYLTLESGSDLIINVGNDSILVENGNVYSFYVNDLFKPASKNIIGTSGSDSIYNPKNNSNATINSGDGNDTIYNYYSNSVIIYGGADDDSITNYGSDSYGDSVTINGGADNDYINNYRGHYSSVNGGAGDDKLYNNWSKNVTINGDAGNDFISLSSDSNNAVIQYVNGDGNDTVYGLNGNDTLKITGAKYSTIKSGDDIKIIVGNGSILVKNKSSIDFTIDGTLGSGTDTIPADTTPADTLPAGISISNSVLTAASSFKGKKIDLAEYPTATKVNASALSTGVSIIGSSVANSIKGGSSADTISGNAGNDTVSLGGGSDIYIYSSGNDLIQDYTAGQDKIKLTSGTISSASVSNNNVILNISNGGKITIQNGKDKEVTFIDSNGKDFKQVYHSNDKPEPVDSLQSGVSVKSSVLTASNKFTGNKIDLANYPTVTKVNASTVSQAVNIVGNSSANSIKGGKSADTVNGGAGKDTILGGAGNDSIYGGNDNDKLQGDAGNDTLNGGNGNDTLTGGAGNDVFVYQGGNDLITDYKVSEDKIKIGSITKSSVKGSDVILTTANGNLTVKGAKDKVVTFIDSNGKTTEKIFYADTSYEPLATGLTYDAKRTALTASTKFTGTEIDLGEYLETVTKVNASAISKSVDITGNSADNSIKAGKGADTIFGGNGKDTILGGAGNDSISGGNDNDKLQGDAGNDTLNGGNGNDMLTGGAGNDVFVYQGGNDLITDYKVSEDKIKIGSITKSSVKGSDVILTTANGNLTVKGAKDKVITFVDNNGKTTEKIFYADTSYEPLATGLTYDAKRMVLTASNKFTGSKIDLDEYLGTVTKVNASAVSQSLNIVGNSADNSINGGKSTDTINGGVGKDTILGGAGNDSIYGGNDNDKLQGDTGNDTLNGGLGNDTLTGGAGNDVFVYEGGNDVITDYKPNEDTIKLLGNTVTASSLSGSNVILKTSGGNITVQNGKNKKITVIDSSGTETTQIYPTDNLNPTPISTLPNGWKYGNNAQTNMTASVSSATNVDLTQSYGTNIVTVDGSKVTKNISITGNEKANVIKGGSGADIIYGGNGTDKLYGNDGNDSLYGGTGNDTLIGGSGRDVYIYNDGDGNDVIEGFDSQSTLKISGNGYSTIKSGNDVIVKFGNGNISLIGAASFPVNIIGTLLGGNTDEIGKNIKNYSGSNAILSGTTGNDSIQNGGWYSTSHWCGGGTVRYVKINAGDGDDSIENWGGNTTINADNGDDDIENRGDSVSINASDGDDYIYNHYLGNYVTIDGGKGNDTVSLDSIWSRYTKIQYADGDGEDNVVGINSDDTLKITGAKYQTLRSGNDLKIKVGNGSILVKNGSNIAFIIEGTPEGGTSETITKTSGGEFVYNSKSYSTITSGLGDDTFYNVNAPFTSINAGEGNDSIFNRGYDVTINAGLGNDKISLDSDDTFDVVFQYANGDGNDVIEGFDSQSTLKISGNGYSTIKSGNDVIVKVGNGSISLIGAASLPVNIVGTLLGGNTDEIGKNIENQTSNTLISGTNGDDSIYSYGWYVTINSGNGSDTIHSEVGSESGSIYAGDGDDYISSYNNNYPYMASGSVTLNAGNGDDTIIASYVRSKVTGGTGNDSIVVLGNENLIDGGVGDDKISVHSGATGNTIKAGTGNDTVVLSKYNENVGSLYQYASGDGNDVIYGINSTDTLQISGAKYSTTKSGKDLIIGVATSSISVLGGANVDFTIYGNHKNEILDNTNECICDLIYDNNFITDEFGIDEISEVTETNYSVGKLKHFSNNNELVNDSIFSASSFDKKS